MRHPEQPPEWKEILHKMKGEKMIKLFTDNELNIRLKEIDAGYPYWDRFKRKTKDFDEPSEVLWAIAKVVRNQHITNLSLCHLPEFKFKYNTTSKILQRLHEFDLHLGGVLEGKSIIPSDDRSRYLISSIMEEAIASSQLEGAATTREIAKQMLRTKRKPVTLSEKMILNNYLTIKKVLEYKDKKITKDLILEIHSIISKGTLENVANEGKFRENNKINVVDSVTGEIFYTPPSHEKIEMLMDHFCEFINTEDETQFTHPIVKGIILHFLIGYIHPFVDGNGRTARAMFYWFLLSKGYWLVEFMSISKIIIRAPAQYAKAYLHTEYDENDLTYFIDYNLKSLDLALQNLQNYIKRKVMEKKNLMHMIKHENVNERQADLMRGLIIDNHQSYTINEVQTQYGISYQTARTDLFSLQEMGYLKEKKFGKKLIFFKVDDFDDKLENVMQSDR